MEEVKKMLAQLMEFQAEMKIDFKEVNQKFEKVEIIQESMQKDIKILIEGQEAYKEQNDRVSRNTNDLVDEKIDIIETVVKSVSNETKKIIERIEALEEMVGKYEIKIENLESRLV